MRFEPTGLSGVIHLVPEILEDERGFFTRLRCSHEFGEAGLPAEFVQTNVSFNAIKGTFRGLHYQIPPSREGKLVRCIKGSIRDIIVDLRPDSDTFLKHVWLTLTAEALNAVFIPSGCAHGFLTLEDESLVLYEMTDYYQPGLARGIRWSDPLLNLDVIDGITRIHPRDAGYPDVARDDLEIFRR